MRSLLYFPFGALAVLVAVLVVYREELGYRFMFVLVGVWIVAVLGAAFWVGIPVGDLFAETRSVVRAALTGIETVLALISLSVAKFKGGYVG